MAFNEISEYFRHKIAEESFDEFEAEIRDAKTRQVVWPVWHRKCSDIAFFLTHHPYADSIKSENVRLFNGRRPPFKSRMICESCRQPIGDHDLLAEMPSRRVMIQLGGSYGTKT